MTPQSNLPTCQHIHLVTTVRTRQPVCDDEEQVGPLRQEIGGLRSVSQIMGGHVPAWADQASWVDQASRRQRVAAYQAMVTVVGISMIEK